VVEGLSEIGDPTVADTFPEEQHTLLGLACRAQGSQRSSSASCVSSNLIPVCPTDACDQGLGSTLLVDVLLEWQLTNVCSSAAETPACAALRGTVEEETAPRRALHRDDEHHAGGAGGDERR